MIGSEENDLNEPSLPSNQETPHQDATALSSSSSYFWSSSSENELHETRNENGQSNENTSRELVLYNPSANDGSVTELVSEPLDGGSVTELVSEPIEHRRPSFFGRFALNSSSRVLPSVGTFTVQCANCFKWRLIPTKEKYEEIREHVLEQPFYCETAREWRPDISCNDPADITQDGSRLWAIDKPNIAQPPPGWQRLLHIRGEGSTKFADVYYTAPSGKKLRSMVEIQKYLTEHPEYQTDGVSMERFSFQIPKPLQENYVRKRRARVNASCDGTRLFEPGEVAPISWARLDDSTASQLGRSELSNPLSGVSVIDPLSRPVKKKAKAKAEVKGAAAKEMHTSTPLRLAEPPAVKVERFDQI